MSREEITIKAWSATAKIVLNSNDYAQIKDGVNCALGVKTNQGDQYYLAQKLSMDNGDEYILERYDHGKLTLFYRLKK